MHILYITNGFPFPLTSGYLRHYFLIKELAQDHRITLLSMVAPGFKEEHKTALEPYTERILTFSAVNKGGSLPKKVMRRVRAVAYQTEESVQRMRQAVDGLRRQEQFDVLISGKRTMDAVSHLHLPLVADMCDATSSRIRRSMRFASPARLPLLMLEYRQMRQAERDFMQRADHSIFISSRDREDLLGAATVGTTIVPNGVDQEFWQRKSIVRGQNTIIFTGAMDYRPNADAALYLIEEILPLVQQKVPTAQLFIVGRDPTPSLVEAGKRPGVVVTGFVDDMRTYMEDAAVFAAPLRFGAGLQNKVLEAMAMEVPVVATPLAADGLRTEEGAQPPLDIVEGKEQFANRLVQKLRESAVDPAPHRAGRLYVESHFVWGYSRQKLNEVITRVTAVPELAF